MKLWDYDAFILDLDGTLIDSGKYHAQAFSDAVLAHSGYSLKPDEHHEFFGKHSTWYAETLNERYGLSLDPAKVLEYKRGRVQEIFRAELFSGAREFLELWHRKKPMALATNSPFSFVKPALEEADVLKFFDCITTGSDVVNRKPDPEIIEVTAQKLRVDPLKTLVFEDQLIGIEAARAAGARVVAVDNNQPVNYPVDVAVHTWRELLKLSEMQ
ncbi:Fructose-1-phosphate phosphatase YqaB [Pontiella desulfatans]|uniref:Fructose-1-phosphate phosphatase YqaB n=1 Tax=Pontiella desulfatans TaxID=2750659 RepID=A0A6C2U3J4_PONDE|nr:HAD family phosphatase [Pontiella desulfatans]VGO14131.1 Fructose-1-phosphate phosphatase YqaB [Pontiella desulfatans]